MHITIICRQIHVAQQTDFDPMATPMPAVNALKKNVHLLNLREGLESVVKLKWLAGSATEPKIPVSAPFNQGTLARLI